jgi:hypothetical protein
MRHVWVCFIPTGCMVGPDYERHDASAPVAVKELAERRISEPAAVRFRLARPMTSNQRRIELTENCAVSVVNAETDAAGVGGDIVDPIRDDLATVGVTEIVHLHLVGTALRRSSLPAFL